jgi:hypothetical protein
MNLHLCHIRMLSLCHNPPQTCLQFPALEVLFDDFCNCVVIGLEQIPEIDAHTAVAPDTVIVHRILLAQDGFSEKRFPEPGSKINDAVPVLSIVAPRTCVHYVIHERRPALVRMLGDKVLDGTTGNAVKVFLVGSTDDIAEQSAAVEAVCLARQGSAPGDHKLATGHTVISSLGFRG